VTTLRPLLPALALLAAGCPHPPAERPGPPPTAAQLMAHLRARAAHLPTLRTEAKVDYLAERGERVKLGMTFLTAPPEQLRIEAESPLGGTVASLASDGKRFELLDARANRFLAGPAAPCNIARLFRVRLTPHDVVEVLGGAAPLLGEPVSTGWDPEDGGREVLTLRDGDLTETLRLAPTTWDVRAAEVTRAGKTLYRLTHDDFTDAGPGLRLPGRSHVFDPERHADAKIRYRDRDVSPKLPPGAFELAAPAGITVENVTCDE
jgi:hypothetical protein